MFKEIFTENNERGVSPVIGVILMVAITVILAAVIGAFVLGLGDQVSNNAPQASFEFDFENKANATITHGGGDDIERSSIRVTVDGSTAYPSVDAEDPYNSTGWVDDPITTGSSVTVFNNSTPGANVAEGGETIRVIWQNPSGGSSNTLGERNWPN